jgi:hypothetical protein
MGSHADGKRKVTRDQRGVGAALISTELLGYSREELRAKFESCYDSNKWKELSARSIMTSISPPKQQHQLNMTASTAKYDAWNQVRLELMTEKEKGIELGKAEAESNRLEEKKKKKKRKVTKSSGKSSSKRVKKKRKVKKSSGKSSSKRKRGSGPVHISDDMLPSLISVSHGAKSLTDVVTHFKILHSEFNTHQIKERVKTIAKRGAVDGGKGQRWIVEEIHLKTFKLTKEHLEHIVVPEQEKKPEQEKHRTKKRRTARTVSPGQCKACLGMHRAHTCSETARIVNETAWSSEENTRLGELVIEYGPGNWREIAAKLESRNAKQCRERWHNQLNPSVVGGDWSDEDRVILEMQARIGNRWAAIAKALPGLTNNEVASRWHSSGKFRKLRNTAEENNKKLTAGQYLPVAAATGIRLTDDQLKDLVKKLHVDHAAPKEKKVVKSKKRKKVDSEDSEAEEDEATSNYLCTVLTLEQRMQYQYMSIDQEIAANPQKTKEESAQEKAARDLWCLRVQEAGRLRVQEAARIEAAVVAARVAAVTPQKDNDSKKRKANDTIQSNKKAKPEK